MRLGDYDNNEIDGAINDIEAPEQPLVRLNVSDAYDISAEFFRWEMANAVAGSVLGINLFD